jgi:hypothetical protein
MAIENKISIDCLVEGCENFTIDDICDECAEEAGSGLEHKQRTTFTFEHLVKEA